MSGAVRLGLEVGDVLLLDAVLVHRGSYLPWPRRRTVNFLYTTARLVDEALFFPTEQPWFDDPRYLAPLGGEARAFFERMIDQRAGRKS